MLDLLYTFGIGLFFAAGVFAGLALFKKYNDPAEEKWEEHRNTVELRLARQCDDVKRIADAVEAMVNNHE